MPNSVSPSPIPTHTPQRTAPLTYRLSNPPPLFKGRQTQIKHLCEAIKRGPVTVVCGMGGIGKTALVLEALHQHFEHQVKNVLQLRVSEENQGLLVEILRMLAVVQEVQIDWSVVLSDPEYALVTAIDLADEGSWWVVLEDLHLAPWQDAQHTLEMLARYARRSRWIATSRLQPAHHMDGQLIELRAMSDAALAAIAADWTPEASTCDIEHHVHRAAGSPWRLYQSLSGGNDTDPNNLDNLSASARGLLDRLVLLRRPVPLQALGPLQSDDVDTLVRRGLAVRAQGALRIHDAARPEAQQRLKEAKTVRQQLIRGLSKARHLPEAALEMLRLTLEGQEDPGEVLEGVGEGLINAGYSPELAALLERTDAKSALQWKFYTAAETGELGRLEHLELPQEPSAKELLQWSRALFELNRFGQTIETLERLEALHPKASVLVQAQILRANALLSTGQTEEALAQINAIQADSDASTRHILDVKAGIYALMGRKEDTLALVQSQLVGLPSLEGAARNNSAMRLVRALYFVSEFAQASALFDETLKAIGPRTFALANGRKAAEIKLALDITEGKLSDMETALERLPTAKGDQHAAIRADMLRMLSWLHRGTRLDEVDALAQKVSQQAKAEHYGDSVATCADLRTQLMIIKGIPYDPNDHHPIEVELVFFLHQYQHRRYLHALLWDHPCPKPPQPDHTSLALLHVFQHTTNALEQALGGQPKEGLDIACQQLEQLQDLRQRLNEIDVLLIVCDLRLMAAVADDRWPKHLQRLRELAALTDSPRLRAAATFFESVYQPETLAPETLEFLAAQDNTAPRSARRAKVLLGESVLPLDRLDQQVLSAIQGQEDWRPISTSLKGPKGLRWGIDLDRKRVWKADGHSVDLSRRARLWGLLETLTRVKSADKETLVVTIWPGEPYHPLKHDNRLRLAVRRLRDLCHDDGSMLQTTRDGYALGGRWRLMHPPRPSRD